MKKTLAIFTIVALLMAITGYGVFATPPSELPGKGQPELSKAVFVHYPKGLQAKGGIPGPPDKPDKPGDDGGGGKLWYKNSGIHWSATSADYRYDPEFAPSSVNYLDAIQAGFNAWTSVDSSNFVFNYDGTTDEGISSLSNISDGANVVGWADLQEAGYSNAIAVTIVWYQGDQIVEVDMAFSNNPQFTWWQDTGDDELWDEGNTSSGYDVDIQNIATHEAGHWLMLGDMYNKPASDQTMYGISAEFDLAKRSLENGDIAGITEIYPN